MKKLFAVLTAFIIAFTLFSCGKEGEEEKTTDLNVEPSSNEAFTTDDVTDETVTEKETEASSLKDETTTAAAAAPKDNGASEQEAAKDAHEDAWGEHLRKYVIDVMKTKHYTMTMNVSSGGFTIDYFAIVSGENTIQSMDMQGLLSMSLISKDGKCYLASPKTERYTEVSYEEFKKQLETVNDYDLEFENLVLEDTYEETVNGKAYTVEKYVSSKDGSVSKYYFRDNALEMIAFTGKSGVEEKRSYSVSPEVDESKIGIPDGYTYTDDAAKVLLK
ncbi:MAG: hypothetical protein K6F09_03620 [Clostridiales bacterium]|nr:hypothetical protein [Clostridiales bacterium]